MAKTTLSPFPGVDPYIEAQGKWRDFHSKFINCWQELLLAKLPKRYDARLNEDVYIDRLTTDEPQRFVVPDVAIVSRPKRRPSHEHGGGVALEEEVALSPVNVRHVAPQERSVAFVEVRETPSGKLVAVLELLSPTNKSGAGRKKYLRKRRALRKARVHLVEVDLLLEGQSPPLATPPPPAHFHVFLTRANRPAWCEVYSWNLQDPLPTIPIPLLKPDPDLPSSLRAVFQLAYERGQYPRAIDYEKPTPLAVEEATRAWAAEQARQFAVAR